MGRIAAFIFSMLMWTMLNWRPDGEQAALGVVISLIGAYMFGDVLDINYRRYLQPKRYLHFAIYIVRLVYLMLTSAVDIAWRVLQPGIPLRSGIIKIKTRLKSDVSRTMLANTLSLSPGTMTVDMVDDDVYVHWLDVGSQDPRKAGQMIAERTEKMIKEIFE